MEQMRQCVGRKAQREDPADDDDLGRNENSKARVEDSVLAVYAALGGDDGGLEFLVFIKIIGDDVGDLVVIHLFLFFYGHEIKKKFSRFNTPDCHIVTQHVAPGFGSQNMQHCCSLVLKHFNLQLYPVFWNADLPRVFSIK